uniref:Uncharacterized protein n=1 Tax=Tolypothrix bouteillei VB521301 TaxID=1479485 RepID=A0A0C1R4Y3_9CYAN
MESIPRLEAGNKTTSQSVFFPHWDAPVGFRSSNATSLNGGLKGPHEVGLGGNPQAATSLRT